MIKKINLFGSIGSWFRGTDHQSISSQLDDMGAQDTVELHINSVGGSLFDGVGIYNSLRQFQGRVVVYVDALAASAASLVALAGDEIIMGEGSVMMVHNPWMVTAADADGHRESADILDILRDSMVGIYETTTGKTTDELKQLLDDETYMSAQEAVDMGFATRVDGRVEDESVAALAQMGVDTSQKSPAWLRDKVVAAIKSGGDKNKSDNTPQSQGKKMDIEDKDEKNEDQNSPENEADTSNEARAEGIKAERERQKEIRTAVKAAKVGESFAETLIDEGLSVAKASKRIFTKLAEDGPEPRKNTAPESSGIEVGETASQKFSAGVQNMILARAGVSDFDPSNAYNGRTMLEIARMSLDRRGVNTAGMGKMDVVGKAFTMPQASGGHTTSDFTSILANSAKKSVLRAYEEADETFEKWTTKGTLTDFKIHSRVDLNSFPSLSEVPEGAEFKNVTMGERKELIQLATYGDIFPISRQAIINDDLNLFSRMPQRMGRAARRTVGDLAYAVLTGNPNMSDGVPLFDSQHGNDGNSAFSLDNLIAAETAMRTQKDATGTSLGIRPAYLLSPVAQQRAIESVIMSQYKPGTQEQENPVRDMVEVIGEHRIDDALMADTWYLTANPAQYDTVEIGYLDGNEQPRVEQQDNWTTDGVSFKVAMDATAAPMDFRTMRKEDGS